MNRKLLLLALFLCIAGNSLASTLVQGNWRWRNNDGDENTASFKAAQNTSIVINDLSVIRLRVRVENTSNSENHNVGALKYSTTPNGTFLNVGADASAAFVYALGTTAPAAKSPTTNSGFLTTINAASLSPYTYMAGEYFDAQRDLSSNADKAPVSPSKYADLEFVIRPTANALPNTTYYFVAENMRSNNDIPSSENSFATLTTSATLPVDFIAFEAKPEKNRIQLKWSTASEKNNDRFEISRSADAKNWQYVASEKGKGNSDVASSYGLIDSKPLNGISYYQLTQFDFDGTKKVLSTQAVNLALDPSVQVQVFPNPVSKEINVSVNNYLGKNIQAALYGQDGKLIHKEQLGGGTQKLALNTMPAAGVYVLKLVGSGLQVNKKVVIL